MQCSHFCNIHMSQGLRQPVNLNLNHFSCTVSLTSASNARPTKVRAAAVGSKQMRGCFGAGVPALDGNRLTGFSLVPGGTERVARKLISF